MVAMVLEAELSVELEVVLKPERVAGSRVLVAMPVLGLALTSAVAVAQKVEFPFGRLILGLPEGMTASTG